MKAEPQGDHGAHRLVGLRGRRNLDPHLQRGPGRELGAGGDGLHRDGERQCTRGRIRGRVRQRSHPDPGLGGLIGGHGDGELHGSRKRIGRPAAGRGGQRGGVLRRPECDERHRASASADCQHPRRAGVP